MRISGDSNILHPILAIQFTRDPSHFTLASVVSKVGRAYLRTTVETPDGLMDGWMDWWIDGLMDGWIDGRMD